MDIDALYLKISGVLAIFIVLLGLILCGYGVVLATRTRPHDLIGAVLSAAGLAIAMVGAARLLSQSLSH